MTISQCEREGVRGVCLWSRREMQSWQHSEGRERERANKRKTDRSKRGKEKQKRLCILELKILKVRGGCWDAECTERGKGWV